MKTENDILYHFYLTTFIILYYTFIQVIVQISYSVKVIIKIKILYYLYSFNIFWIYTLLYTKKNSKLLIRIIRNKKSVTGGPRKMWKHFLYFKQWFEIRAGLTGGRAGWPPRVPMYHGCFQGSDFSFLLIVFIIRIFVQLFE